MRPSRQIASDPSGPGTTSLVKISALHRPTLFSRSPATRIAVCQRVPRQAQSTSTNLLSILGTSRKLHPLLGTFFPGYLPRCRVADFKDLKIRAKEVKEAALEILGVCHGAEPRRLVTRDLERRVLPLAVIVPFIIETWTGIAYMNIAYVSCVFF